MEGKTLSESQSPKHAQPEPNQPEDSKGQAGHQALIQRIIKALGETDRKPIRQIINIVKLGGPELAEQMLQDTLEIEAQGGMLVQSGNRRRTPGGVFFQLARERLPNEARQQIFYTWRVEAQRRAEREASYEPFDWQERGAVFEALTDAGVTTDVKISLTGRPAQMERRQHLVIATMRDQMEEDLVFPNGVPHPHVLSRDYMVYISSKQWERVEKAMNDPEDQLVVEGYCGYDEEIDGIAVFSMNVTTRKLQKRDKQATKNANQAQKGAPSQKGGPAQKGSGPKKDGKAGQGGKDRPGGGQRKAGSGRDEPQRRDRPRRDRRDEPLVSFDAPEPQPEPQPEEPEITVPIPQGMPEDMARRYVELHRAAQTFRQKIAAIEAKPEDQRFGLEMTQKLLSNTERQIKALEKQYPL